MIDTFSQDHSSTKKHIHQLRSISHGLRPVVILGQKGLTPSLLKEIGSALFAHELIKIKCNGYNRKEAEKMAEKICLAHNCILVQRLGLVLTFYKKREDVVEKEDTVECEMTSSHTPSEDEEHYTLN